MADAANGADKLITSILEEAHKAAADMEKRAEERAQAIRRQLDEDMEGVREELSRKAELAREETLARAAVNSELAARKELLEKKRALIDEAYAKAMSGLSSLSGEKREGLMKKLLSRECAGGETVCPAEKDRKLIEKLIAESGLELKLGESDPAIEDGFTVKGVNFVKDCSFAALMEEVKGETLSSVAKRLFN